MLTAVTSWKITKMETGNGLGLVMGTGLGLVMGNDRENDNMDCFLKFWGH